MPKTIPLVNELEWKATGKNSVDIGGVTHWREGLSASTVDRVWSFTEKVPYCFFTESCRQKLLKAMDDFGKVEEPEHWKFAAHWAESNPAIGPTVQHSKCLIELRARVEALERGKV